jgi:hypothetical protein
MKEIEKGPPVLIKLGDPEVVAHQVNEFAKHLDTTIPNRETIVLAYAERLFQFLAAADASDLGVSSHITF